MKLLLVEDNAELSHWIVNLLQGENFAVDCVPDGESADAVLLTEVYAAGESPIVAERMSGKDVLARLRRRGDNAPVLMLTAHGSIDDKVDCFSAGADEYVVKPFEHEEVLARVRTHWKLRRLQLELAAANAVLETRVAERTTELQKAPLALRRREHAILEALMLKQGKTVSKTALMDSVYSLEDEPSADAIDIYIHRLRKHLTHSTAQIMTLRGLGYVLRAKDGS